MALRHCEESPTKQSPKWWGDVAEIASSGTPRNDGRLRNLHPLLHSSFAPKLLLWRAPARKAPLCHPPISPASFTPSLPSCTSALAPKLPLWRAPARKAPLCPRAHLPSVIPRPSLPSWTWQRNPRPPLVAKLNLANAIVFKVVLCSSPGARPAASRPPPATTALPRNNGAQTPREPAQQPFSPPLRCMPWALPWHHGPNRNPKKPRTSPSSFLSHDPNLEGVIRERIDKPEGDILNTDLVGTGLDFSSRFMSAYFRFNRASVLCRFDEYRF